MRELIGARGGSDRGCFFCVQKKVTAVLWVLPFSCKGLYRDTDVSGVFSEEIVTKRCKECSDHRSDDEDEQILDRICLTCEERPDSRSDASCRVYGCACKTNAKNMYKGQGKSDNKTCNVAVLELLRCYTEDNKNEYECKNDLNEKSCDDAVIKAAYTV